MGVFASAEAACRHGDLRIGYAACLGRVVRDPDDGALGGRFVMKKTSHPFARISV